MLYKLSTILVLLLNSQTFAMNGGSYVFNPITNRQCHPNNLRLQLNTIQHDTVFKDMQDTSNQLSIKPIFFQKSQIQKSLIKIDGKCPFQKIPDGMLSDNESPIVQSPRDDVLDDNMPTARAVSGEDNISIQEFMNSFDADDEDDLSSSLEDDAFNEEIQTSTNFYSKWKKNKQMRNAVTEVNIAIQKLKEVKKRHVEQIEETRKNKLNKITKINKSLMKKKYFPKLIRSKSKG